MATKKELVVTNRIADAIHLVRGQKVMLDVQSYGVQTIASNWSQSVTSGTPICPKRRLRSQIVSLKRGERRKFSELEARVGKQDENIAAIIEAIRQLIAPPVKPRRQIGFLIRETAPRYGTRKAR
jgi:hypothetical protein